MFNSMRQTLLASVLATAGLLSACGGGSDNGDSSSSSSSSAPAVDAYATCAATDWFCDDFQSGSVDKWDLAPGTGSFGVVEEPDRAGNKVLQYTAGSTNGGVIALVKDTAWANVSNKADYYVEARIKPQINSTTGNKQLYLISRYQDASNWYLGGLNVQNSSGSTQVEAGYMKAGTISRVSQSKRAIIMGTQGQSDGQWYTVRYEMIGGVGSVYLDGEKMTGTVSDTAFASGKIGLYTANKSFLIDDIKVGDPAVKPVALVLSPSALTYSAEAADAAYSVTVTALKNDGVTTDSFTAVSSNTAVVSASVSGNVVTLTPVGAGTANIVFTSGSDAKTTRTITATIAAAFVQSSTVYTLSSKVVPAVGETAAYADGKLSLTFDAPPTLGTAGSIRIFRKSDDALVDVIKMSGETDSIGLGYASQYRGVSTTPVKVSGNSVIISPHLSNIAYGTEYYVAIADGAITGTLSGKSFNGLGKASGWSFTTRAAPSSSLTTLTVDDDGAAADFRSVQGALNYVMKNVAADTAATINVQDGSYEELLFLRSKNNLTIKGQSRTGTIISYDNDDTRNTGSGASATGTPTSGGGRAVFLVEASDNLVLDTLTLKNNHIRSTTRSNQAETIYFNSPTGRLTAKDSEFWSEQDTLQLNGYVWFYNTLVAGNVDYIWGSAKAALFENSEIRTLGDSYYGTTPSGGYILQSRSAAGEKGFVFLNSSLTYGVGPGGNTVATGTTYLARAAAGSWVDTILFMNCKMDTHIAPVGWAANIAGNPAPNPVTATASTGWREYGSMDISGNALDVSSRVATNSYQLTGAEAAAYDTRAEIFAGYNSGAGWAPVP
jgi:pectate lyase